MQLRENLCRGKDPAEKIGAGLPGAAKKPLANIVTSNLFEDTVPANREWYA